MKSPVGEVGKWMNWKGERQRISQRGGGQGEKGRGEARGEGRGRG